MFTFLRLWCVKFSYTVRNKKNYAEPKKVGKFAIINSTLTICLRNYFVSQTNNFVFTKTDIFTFEFYYIHWRQACTCTKEQWLIIIQYRYSLFAFSHSIINCNFYPIWILVSIYFYKILISVIYWFLIIKYYFQTYIHIPSSKLINTLHALRCSLFLYPSFSNYQF